MTLNYMLFEVWEDIDGGGQIAGVVHPQNDKMRRIDPSPMTCVHSFRAYSDRDFWRQFYSWDGRDEWQPDPGLPEQFYSAEDVEVQRRYLEIRQID
ncbi:MAG: hypothetical protein JWM65_3370 [Sphingomonas bacterium]|nr:hypothetical protein [Sphingomonas bacterium]